MAIFKCKMCGGDLNVVEGVTVSECEYCGTKQTLPRVGEESITNLFNRANRLRMHCEFDKAEEVYEKIINLDDTESEAHWGLVLCKYGIEYVEDPNTLERIPTCHRTSFEAVTQDNDYLLAISNADSIRKELYEKEAKRIEELQKDVLKIVNNEKPFDVFICYKESDETGERTPDSVLAEEIYDALSEKGYRVFFSRITLEEKLGVEYEPYIFAALNSAKVMLVVGTKPNFMEAVWVRNEWSRYLKIMKKDHSKLLIPCYKDMDPYDLPEAFGHLQAQNMQKIGAIQDLVRGIGKIVKADSNANAIDAYSKSSNNGVLIDRAMSYLKDGNFATAATTCNEVLKNDPQNGMAYVGLLMSELKIKEFNFKDFQKKKYKKNSNYQKACENADDYIKEKFDSFESLKKKKDKLKLPICLLSVLTVVAIAFLSLEIIYSTAVKNFFSGEYNVTSLSKTFNTISFYKQSSAYEIMVRRLAGYEYTPNANIKEIEAPGYALPYGTMFPSLERIVVHSGVKEIENDAFKYSFVREVILPDGVKSIGASAFSGCMYLTSVTIPNSVTKIGDSAFFGCRNLTSITIPDGVTIIGDSAFYGCSNLTSITIPDGVTIIGNSAFFGCRNLTSITIPDSVTNIGSAAFLYCKSLKTVTVGPNVKILEGVFPTNVEIIKRK